LTIQSQTEATHASQHGKAATTTQNQYNSNSEEAIRLCRERGHIAQIAFSPTGRYLATANGNGTVYILRLKPK
jgi:WD40 repeat protein